MAGDIIIIFQLMLNKTNTTYSLKEIELFTINGKFESKHIVGGNTKILNIDHLDSGIYLIRIKFDDEVIVRKFIKL